MVRLEIWSIVTEHMGVLNFVARRVYTTFPYWQDSTIYGSVGWKIPNQGTDSYPDSLFRIRGLHQCPIPAIPIADSPGSVRALID